MGVHTHMYVRMGEKKSQCDFVNKGFAVSIAV